jgi:hypothetical protein
MYARVTTWEGVPADSMREFNAMIAGESGPPEGVPSTGITVLDQPESGRRIVIGLFPTEDDLRKGDETLRAMPRPPGVTGEVKSVEFYEVGTEVRM